MLLSRERDEEFSLSHLSKKGLVGAGAIYHCMLEEQKNNDSGTCCSGKQRGLKVVTNNILRMRSPFF